MPDQRVHPHGVRQVDPLQAGERAHPRADVGAAADIQHAQPWEFMTDSRVKWGM
jgi:hypothetical protein